VYRLTAQGTGSSDENLAAAINNVYGISLDDFILHWDARLHELAGLPFTPEASLDTASGAPERTATAQPAGSAAPSPSR
jgi:acyl dehydratase